MQPTNCGTAIEFKTYHQFGADVEPARNDTAEYALQKIKCTKIRLKIFIQCEKIVYQALIFLVNLWTNSLGSMWITSFSSISLHCMRLCILIYKQLFFFSSLHLMHFVGIHFGCVRFPFGWCCWLFPHLVLIFFNRISTIFIPNSICYAHVFSRCVFDYVSAINNSAAPSHAGENIKTHSGEEHQMKYENGDRKRSMELTSAPKVDRDNNPNESKNLFMFCCWC